MFSIPADAMRLRGEELLLELPGASSAPSAVPESAVEAAPEDKAELEDFPSLDFSETRPFMLDEQVATPSEATEIPLAEDIDFSEFSAALADEEPGLTEAAAVPDIELPLSFEFRQAHILSRSSGWPELVAELAHVLTYPPEHGVCDGRGDRRR